MELCIFLRGAGHFEKATALFQAQIEFNFFRPTILSSETPHKDAIDFMSVYWDSSAPKVGEPASEGWSSWVEKGGVHSSGAFWYSKGTISTVYVYLLRDYISSSQTAVVVRVCPCQNFFVLL